MLIHQMFMRKRTILILVIVGIFLAVSFYGWKEYHREAESLHSLPAVATVNAAALISEFENGDAANEKKYLGKVIAVKGNIKALEKDGEGNYTIVLGSNDVMSAVRCSMDSTTYKEVDKLIKGTVVNIKGIFTGFQKDETGLLGSDIKLNRSVLN